MKIKTKLRLGFTFLFVVYIFLGGLAIWYIHELSKASNQILKNNYYTLQYMQSLLKHLGDNEQVMSAKDLQDFDRSLRLEESNITEAGEGKAVKQIRNSFTALKLAGTDKLRFASIKSSIRSNIFTVMQLNNATIIQKDYKAKQLARTATIIVAFIASICFLIILSFIMRFPGYITDTIRELSDGMKESIRQNFKYRVPLPNETDELAELCRLLNSLNKKMEEDGRLNQAKLRIESMRIETIINNIKEAIIGVDENNMLLFANQLALDIMNLKPGEVSGKSVGEIAGVNEQLDQIFRREPASEQISLMQAGKTFSFKKEVFPLSVNNTDLKFETQTILQSVKSIGSIIMLKSLPAG
ncbi:MAG TPA: PAS domain-containing protein [Daejeonella sp.]|nr:PAS domain-containing protein [Daejeonella sp.]